MPTKYDSKFDRIARRGKKVEEGRKNALEAS